MLEQLSGVPMTVTAALTRLKEDLARAAGQNLAGFMLYGGVARGRYRQGKSDVNVVVLLQEASAAALAAIAPALQTARRSAGVEPLVLTTAEVAQGADVFPTKWLDIKNHHVVLAGVDPFAQLEISREQIRFRTEQELRNLLMRLRQRYLIVVDDPALLTRALGQVARPLALELAALLQLAGKELPEVDHTADIFAAAATAFQLDGEALSQLAALRQDSQLTVDVNALFSGILTAITQAVDIVDRMEEPRR